MIRRYLIKYVILLLIFVLCAGAALYLKENTEKSHEDAVLACLDLSDNLFLPGQTGQNPAEWIAQGRQTEQNPVGRIAQGRQAS